MASTDQRSGFRLPWSSDRSHDQQPGDPSTEEPAAISDGSEATSEDENVVWPESDLNARLGLTSHPRPADAPPGPDSDPNRPTTSTPEEATMLDQAAPTAPERPAPRKPSRLMVELSAAIRSTAESAREQALAQVDADVAQVVEAIRGGSKDGETAIRAKSDEDVAGIKEWSREEIARVKAETEARIDARKGQLAAQLEAHAAAIEARVGEVQGTADDYRGDMTAYAARLETETDPAHLATLAESMPEPPSLQALADLGDLAWSVPEPEPEAEVELVTATEAEAAVEVDAVAETVAEPETVADVMDAPGDAETREPAEAIAETIETPETPSDAETIEPAASSDAAPAWGEPTSNAWGDEQTGWSSDGVATAVADGDGTARWADGETPDGFPAGEEGGDPVDRGAIMAALEAAAEAVVAAESAAESAGQAEAAADLAETAAELLKGRVDAEDELDPEAHAAMAARVDAGGVEESYTDRLAKLLPNHPDATGGTEPRQTAVVVSGLVSVASIASFKRHLGRVPGVQNVTVASGPDGEFVFNVMHLPDVSFREALPTMPGFAARVTGNAEGTVHVTARDPEAEG
jgi:hypothetical protein